MTVYRTLSYKYEKLSDTREKKFLTVPLQLLGIGGLRIIYLSGISEECVKKAWIRYDNVTRTPSRAIYVTF